MEHGINKEQLSALLDGELHGAERGAVLAHLEACADCRAYLAELTALRAALGELEEYDAPEGFAAGVMARMRAEGETAQRRADGEIMPIRAEGAMAQPRKDDAPNAVKRRAARRGYAALAACAAVALLAVYALPNALRMGGNNANLSQKSAVADSASSGSAVYASPSSAPAPEESSSASGMPGALAGYPESPDSDYDYAYAGGGSADGTRLESVREKEDGAADADVPGAANDSVENDGAANEKEYVSSTTADEGGKLPIANGDAEWMTPLSRPEAYEEDFPIVTLCGEGAEGWLAEHGRQGESGAWYADAAELRALPENLRMLYSELSEDYDGAVYVELWEAEP